MYAEQYGSDPGKKRDKAKKATPAPVPAAEKNTKPSYAEPVGQQATGVSSGPSATAGTIFGSALIITKLVQMFRRFR